MDVKIKTRPVKKQKISATIDVTVINEIEKIKAHTKYANFSSVTNEILKQGLEAQGIKIEV
jgi:hypothetical protein